MTGTCGIPEWSVWVTFCYLGLEPRSRRPAASWEYRSGYKSGSSSSPKQGEVSSPFLSGEFLRPQGHRVPGPSISGVRVSPATDTLGWAPGARPRPTLGPPVTGVFRTAYKRWQCSTVGPDSVLTVALSVRRRARPPWGALGRSAASFASLSVPLRIFQALTACASQV